MAIQKRLNKPLRVVALTGEHELLGLLSYEEQRKYQMTRDIEALPLHKLEEPATVFTIVPLLPDFEYLLDAVDAGNTAMARELVRCHIMDVEGFDGAEFEDKQGRKILSKASIDLLPLDVVKELQTVIREGVTRGNLIPFSLQDTIAEHKKAIELKRLFA